MKKIYPNPEIAEVNCANADLLIVTLAIPAFVVLSYYGVFNLLGHKRISVIISQYVGAILRIYVPILLVKLMYGLPKEILGLKRGNSKLSLLVLMGAITGIIIFSCETLVEPGLAHIDLKTIISNLPFINKLTISTKLQWLAIIVFIPIGEEITFRGFLYGWLRKRYGVLLGLFLQSLLFTLIHFSHFYYGNIFGLIHTFTCGIILGLLYEKTGSLYPSAICHGMINYLKLMSLGW